MSHIRKQITNFDNLHYLKKVLSHFKIIFSKEFNKKAMKHPSLIITQENGHDIKFSWDNEYQKYILKFDKSYWKQSYSIEGFLDKISQRYASERIFNENQTENFQLIDYRINNNQHALRSEKLVLERYVTQSCFYD